MAAPFTLRVRWGQPMQEAPVSAQTLANCLASMSVVAQAREVLTEYKSKIIAARPPLQAELWGAPLVVKMVECILDRQGGVRSPSHLRPFSAIEFFGNFTGSRKRILPIGVASKQARDHCQGHFEQACQPKHHAAETETFLESLWPTRRQYLHGPSQAFPHRLASTQHPRLHQCSAPTRPPALVG